MHKVELLVTLKIPDVTALTASNTLRRRLGYGDVLTRLDRADYYLFDVEADSEDEACEVVRNLAERTTIFVNPNKHSFQVRPHAPSAEVPRRGDVYEVRCLVREVDYDPAPQILAQVARTELGKSIGGLQVGTLWTLHLRAPSADGARQLAHEIAVTRSRSKGLLVNPHYQVCEVF